MEIRGAVCVVTGAASGIGRALAERFAAEGAAGVVCADLDGAGAEAVASSIGDRAVGTRTDVGVDEDVAALVRLAEQRFGPVDLYCSNAGIGVGLGPESPDEEWDLSWRVNVMGGVLAARHVLPSMLERGRGHILITASAAGLLAQLGSATYSVTKHAAVALAEWLSITYGDRGITVSCLCPQGVNTPMLTAGGIASSATRAVVASGGVLEPADVAGVVVEALRDGRFLVLPHPEVATYLQRKGTDHDRWLAGMRRLQARLDADA